MGVITIQCPRTGRWVSTGLELDRMHFDRMHETRFTMKCWICGSEHVWSKRWATFRDDGLVAVEPAKAASSGRFSFRASTRDDQAS